jgi:hypothetical protein
VSRGPATEQADLEEIPEQASGLLSGVPGLMNLLQVVRLCEVALPNLPEEWLAEVEKLVLLEVTREVGVLRVKVVSRYPICSVSQSTGKTETSP